MNYYDKQAETTIYYCKLPHWRQSTVCYFVTFRTADSLPQAKLDILYHEREQWLSEHPEPISEQAMAEYHKLFTRKIELWLDNGYGSCILKDESIKQIIISALDYFSDIRYRLWEYTVAANHVHLLIEPIGDHQLSDIMHSLKRHTARHINKQSGKSGAFWQREYFDHIVRSEAQLFKFVQYIRNHDPGAIYEKGRRRSSKGGSSL